MVNKDLLKEVDSEISNLCESGRDFTGIIAMYVKDQDNIIYFEDGSGVSKNDIETLKKLQSLLNTLFESD